MAKNILVSLGTVIGYLWDLVIMIVYVTIYTDSSQNIFWPSLFVCLNSCTVIKSWTSFELTEVNFISADKVTHTLTKTLRHSLPPSLARSFVCSLYLSLYFTRSLARSLSHSFFHSFIYSFIHSLSPSLPPSLALSLVRPSMRPFVRSFIHSFILTLCWKSCDGEINK